MLLADLGERICILGPSNSGKSTLANAIALKCGLEPIHLDRLFHLPGSNWQPRPLDAFIALHDAALTGERWVIEGNYTRCLPQRLRRATGLILLDVATTTSMIRYLRRTLFERERAGALEGGRDSLKWVMVHHILFRSPGNRKRMALIFDEQALPKVALSSLRDIERAYHRWGLQR